MRSTEPSEDIATLRRRTMVMLASTNNAMGQADCLVELQLLNEMEDQLNREEYLGRFMAECEAEIQLTQSKNADYASASNPFANFELIEALTDGRVSCEQGILVRMSDKLKRVANLITRPAAVKDESISDTLRDLSVYAKILKIRLDSKGDKTSDISPGRSFRCKSCGIEKLFTARSTERMFGGDLWVIDNQGGAHLLKDCSEVDG